MFYLVTPSETSFPDVASIPFSLVSRAPPYFLGLILLEWSLKCLKGDTPRINDGIMNVVHGLFRSLME